MIARRAVLAGTVVAAASAFLPAPAQGAEMIAPVPRTVARRYLRRPGDRVDTTMLPISHLAVSWSGQGEPSLRLRTVSGWGAPRRLSVCRAARDDGDGQRWALITAPGTSGYQLLADDRTDPVSIIELNTTDGPAAMKAARPPAAGVQLAGRNVPARYLSRAGWGADESLRFDAEGNELWPPEYFPVQTLTVHHTATGNDDPDPAATVRAILYFHAVTQGWGDIGYHLLIDEAGTVYEGRYSGPDGWPVFGPSPGSDGRPVMVNAGHVGGYNAGNVGVALLGNLTDRPPTAAAQRSLTAVLAALAGVDRLNPLGATDYVNPISGAQRRVDTISGHRDWLPTECPGTTFYSRLPNLRRAVARLVVRSGP